LQGAGVSFIDALLGFQTYQKFTSADHGQFGPLIIELTTHGSGQDVDAKGRPKEDPRGALQRHAGILPLRILLGDDPLPDKHSIAVQVMQSFLFTKLTVISF
jgi:hypothetical protein